MLYTVGVKYFQDYVLYMQVTKGLASISQVEADDYYKIIYIKSGPCNFILNDREFILTGAGIICMNEKDIITFNKVCGDDISIIWFKPSVVNSKLSIEVIDDPGRLLSTTEHQDIFYLNQFLKDAEASSKVLSLHSMDSSGIEHKIHMIQDLLDKQDSNYWPCRSRSYLFEILFILTRQEEAEDTLLPMLPYEGEARFAVDVIYYLQSCYNKKITIEMLTDQFHTNRTTLLSDFKKLTGVSVNRYLVELRLKMAILLLQDTELTIDEISERTGFHDISYFSKVFKRKLSCTPSEYRKINKCDPYGNKYT